MGISSTQESPKHTLSVYIVPYAVAVWLTLPYPENVVLKGVRVQLVAPGVEVFEFWGR